MHVPKEFSDYVTVIRSTCALRTVFLQFTRSPHVGNCAVRNSDELYSFMDKEIAYNRYTSTARGSLQLWYVVQLTRGQMQEHVCFWERRRDGLNQNG